MGNAGQARGAIAAATVAVVALLTASAQAMTFPGANGKIAVERSTETAENDIFAINPDGSAELNLTHNGANNRQIAWSADGTRVAFFSDGDGSDNYYDIHVATADGAGVTRLTTTGNTSQPAWSPDGRSIAFVDRYLYVVGADGTGQRALTQTEFASDPAWSPDGSWIVFDVETWTHGDLFAIHPDGSGLTRLTDDQDQFPRWPSWSPDGTRIAYVTSREAGCTSGCPGLWVMNADGTNERKLIDGSVVPTWSPDGSRIAYTRDRDGYQEIYTVDPDSGVEQQVTNSSAGEYGPEWSPDGTQLVFERSSFQSESEIRVINRDGTGERFVTRGGAPQWQPLPIAKDAKRLCKAERRRLANKVFRKRYGKTKNGTDAFRNCVAGRVP